MVNSHSPSTFSPSSSLLCQEAQDKENEETGEEDLYEFAYPSDKERDEDDAYVQILLHRELSGLSSHPHMINDWIKSARLDSIQWIFNTRALLGFQFQTAYLSITYFDLFLSRRIIDSEKYWAVRLLSVACLSLAAKMEECRVPSLTDFQMEDYNFESKVIQRMELLVLNTLEWKMGLITPLDYLHYFISKFCKQTPSRDVAPRVVDLIFVLTKDINSMSCRPSVMAAAATLLALDQKLTKQCIELKISTSSCGILQTEDVFSCYNRMQELDKEKIKLPESNLSPNLSPVQLKGADVFGNSSVNSAVSTKRKRLKFKDYDQNYGMPDEKRTR